MEKVVSNAIRYTNQGGISVNCHVLGETKEDWYIEFVVKDTGIGIKDVSKLFKPFYQLHEGNVGKASTGLVCNFPKKEFNSFRDW